MVPELFRFKKIRTFNFPILGANVSAADQTVFLDLKDFVQKETISRLFIRIVGNVVIAGAGAGVATGRDTEQIVSNVILTTAPSLGVIQQNNINGRDFTDMGIYDKGFSFRAAAIVDTAGTTAVDFSLPVTLKMPGSINPIEWALPMAAFESAILQITVSGRNALFTGGTNTWDMSGLSIAVFVDLDDGVAGDFHVVEHLVKTYPIVATQSDFPLAGLDAGYIYTHLLFKEEAANAKVNNILNSLTIQSAGRIWLPQGDGNKLEIQRWNRETHVNSSGESLTGLTFVPALRDGMYKRGIDSLDAKLDIKCDVTTQASAILKLYARRIIPLAVKAVGVRPAGA